MTLYSDIYQVFIVKINDYNITGQSLSVAEYQMFRYLKSARVKFARCKTSLSDFNDTTAQFNGTLSEYEIEILATLMVVEWCSNKVYDINLMKQALTSQDFKIYSQAQHLHELTSMKKSAKEDSDKLIIDYGYDTAENYDSLGD